MKEILRELCALDGVSGYEQKVRDFIKKMAQPYAEEMIEDSLGNVMVMKKGVARRAEPVVIATPMDEAGFLVRGYTSDGYLKLTAVGKFDLRGMAGCRVTVGCEGTSGMIIRKKMGATADEKWGETPALSDLLVDIGESSDVEARKRASIGDPVALWGSFAMFGEQCVMAKGLRSRVGCAIALKMLQEELPYDTWFAFTVGGVTSDTGARGAIPVGNRLKPRYTLILGAKGSDDLPSVLPHKQTAKMRHGAVVSLIDIETVYHRGLRKKIVRSAEKEGIRWQYDCCGAGGNDGAALHVAGMGADAFGLSVPVRGFYNATNVMCMKDLEEAYRMAVLFNREAGEWNV